MEHLTAWERAASICSELCWGQNSQAEGLLLSLVPRGDAAGVYKLVLAVALTVQVL